jgi:regulator of protease activity HflC (stomatin/prohibitin superfamily)
MFEWLGNLMEWFGAWIPRLLIICRTHGGVKFRHGHDAIALESGLHLYWPLVTEVMEYPVKRHTHEFDCQSLTTTDDVDIIISVAVVCEVYDILAALAENYDINDTVSDVTRGTIAEVILSHTFEQITGEFHKVRETLESEIGEALSVYGITVLEVKIMELSKCQTFRVAGAAGTVLPVPLSE